MNALPRFKFNYAQVWGITVGGAVLQNRLTNQLPADFIARFPEGTAIAYSLIPEIGTLPQPLQRQVRDAFAEALHLEWLVLVGIAVLGFITSLLMKGIPLHNYVDNKWALQEKEETPGDKKNIESESTSQS